MKFYSFILTIVFITSICYCQTDSLYLGQTPPGNTAVIFARGIVSNSNSHNRLIVSPDGKEIFWNVANFTTWESKIYSSIFRRGRWSDPEIPSFAAIGTIANVLFSPDGKKLFFDYRDNVNSDWITKYVKKIDSVWSEPKSDGFLFDLSSSFTTNGRVYYSSSMANSPWGNGIYSADYSETGLSNIRSLPESINTRNIINYASYIAPDESFLLFTSNRPMTGGNDNNMYLYVSFHNNGEWSTPQKINSAIGFSGKARLPSISPDGKYLFFCGDDRNYYWVDINAVKGLNPTGIETEKTLPVGIILHQNYPNPFNPSTTINYRLSTVGNVNLKIYDVLGREIKTFTNSYQSAGNYSVVWDGMDDSNNPVCSGIYFYRLEAGSISLHKKMLLVR